LLREEVDQYKLTGPLRTVAIPDTLQDALMARLDQLNRAKEVAQLGAVLGREFAYELLLAITLQDENALQEGLAQLVAAELLYQRGRPPRARYVFKHALIQDAAYASLLKSTRQQVHQQIAQVLERQFPALVEMQPELLAQHYTAAGCHEQAVVYWQRAGQQASDRSAYLEAISHMTTGIELLKSLPETPEHTKQALTMGTILRGWALAMQGQGEAGMAQLHQGIATWRATGAALLVPWFCTLLAEASDHLGHMEDGLQALAEASTLVEQHEERFWEAEVCHLRGVLLLRQPGTPQAGAEAWLQRALDVARRQEAKSLELRAAMAGSRRALTPPTSRRPKPCSKNWRDNTGEHNIPLQHLAQSCSAMMVESMPGGQ
jgi:predicted ATPase